MSDTATQMTFATALFLLRRAGLPVENKELDCLAGEISESKLAVDASGAAERLAAALTSEAGFQGGLGRAFSRMVVQVVDGDHHCHVAALRRARFGNSLPMLAGIADQHNGGVAIRWALVLDVGDDVYLLDPNPWDDIAEDRHMPLHDFIVRWQLASSVLISFRQPE